MKSPIRSSSFNNSFKSPIRSSSFTNAPTELSIALASYQWDEALAMVAKNPSLCRTWSQRLGFFEGRITSLVLPLHEASTGVAPPKVAEAILEAYPDACRQEESAYKRLPLHCACRRGANPSVVRLLLKAYTHAALVPDILGRLPLHYALSNGADPEIVGLLVEYAPTSTRGVDDKGWTPLHVACSASASTLIIRRLLDLYPEAVIHRTDKGSTPGALLHTDCVNRPEVVEILKQARSDFDREFSNPLTASTRSIEDLMIV